MSSMKIGVIGLGVVGQTIFHTMKFFHNKVIGYDKYKPSSSFKNVCDTDIIFVAVPTDENERRLDCSIIVNVLKKLEAISLYQSQIRSNPHPRSYDGVKTIAKLRGKEICVEAAEAFICHRMIIGSDFH